MVNNSIFILQKVSQIQRDQGFSGAFWAKNTESGFIFAYRQPPRIGVERTGYLDPNDQIWTWISRKPEEIQPWYLVDRNFLLKSFNLNFEFF